MLSMMLIQSLKNKIDWFYDYLMKKKEETGKIEYGQYEIGYISSLKNDVNNIKQQINKEREEKNEN